MPYYNMRRISDNKVLSDVYRNHDDALANFGEKFKVALSLNWLG